MCIDNIKTWDLLYEVLVKCVECGDNYNKLHHPGHGTGMMVRGESEKSGGKKEGDSFTVIVCSYTHSHGCHSALSPSHRLLAPGITVSLRNMRHQVPTQPILDFVLLILFCDQYSIMK